MKRALLDAVNRGRAERRSFVLATRLPDGQQRLWRPEDDEAGDPLQSAARDVLLKDSAETHELAGETWLLTPFQPPLRLLVVGAVHVSQALVPMARLLDFEVTVIDPRRAFATPERFRGITLVHEWPETALARLGLNPRSALITLSHDRKLDEPAIALALASPCFYIGALGSRKTQEARKGRLAERFSEAELARIHGPVGLAIGARSPAEIRLSILAEVVRTMRVLRP